MGVEVERWHCQWFIRCCGLASLSSQCNQNTALRMIENLIHVLMWFITDAYSSFVFFEILSANRLWYAVACGPHPPNVVCSRGVKMPFSTCCALSHLYFSFCTNSCLGNVSRFDGEYDGDLNYLCMVLSKQWNCLSGGWSTSRQSTSLSPSRR